MKIPVASAVVLTSTGTALPVPDPDPVTTSFLQDEPREGAAEPDPAQRILETLRETYAGCETYQDEGEVEQVFLKEDGKRTIVLPFSTAFERDGDFRYEFQSRAGEYEWHRYVVWTDGDAIHSWWTIKPEVKSHPTLEKALSGPSGVSGGSATTIPALLIPEMRWGAWLRHECEATLEEHEDLDGTWCARIRLEPRFGPPWTAWIDEERGLLRRLLQTKEVNDFSVRTTITYRPRLDEPVPSTMLGFEPPTK